MLKESIYEGQWLLGNFIVVECLVVVGGTVYEESRGLRRCIKHWPVLLRGVQRGNPEVVCRKNKVEWLHSCRHHRLDVRTCL